jgi:hypothetical protein
LLLKIKTGLEKKMLSVAEEEASPENFLPGILAHLNPQQDLEMLRELEALNKGVADLRTKHSTDAMDLLRSK